MDQDIKTIEFDCLRGNVNKYGKIIETKISHLNPYFSGIYMEPSLCATQNTQNERFIPVWLTRTWKQDRNLFHVILGNKRTADFTWYKYYKYYYALYVENNMTDPHGGENSSATWALKTIVSSKSW